MVFFYCCYDIWRSDHFRDCSDQHTCTCLYRGHLTPPPPPPPGQNPSACGIDIVLMMHVCVQMWNCNAFCFCIAVGLQAEGVLVHPPPPPPPSICCGSSYWVYSSSDDIIHPKHDFVKNGLILTASQDLKQRSMFVKNGFDFWCFWSNELLNVSVLNLQSGARLCLHVTLHQQQGEGWLEEKKQKQEKLQQQVLASSFYDNGNSRDDITNGVNPECILEFLCKAK